MQNPRGRPVSVSLAETEMIRMLLNKLYLLFPSPVAVLCNQRSAEGSCISHIDIYPKKVTFVEDNTLYLLRSF